jgi:DNA polymerase elongation subunit (family B)
MMLSTQLIKSRKTLTIKEVDKITKKDLIFQTLSWYEDDFVCLNSTEDEEEEEKVEYQIYVHGVTKEGMTVCLRIMKFVPYFYVQIPETLENGWGVNETNEFYKYIKKRLGKNKYGLVTKKLVKRCKLYPFENLKKHKFIRLGFCTNVALRKCKYLFSKPLIIYNISCNALQYNSCETNLHSMLRYIHIRDIRMGGWIRVKKGDYTVEDDDISRSQINATVNWKQVYPVETEDIAPIVTLSYDLETYSSLGYPEFPDAELSGDYISQIGVCLWEFNGSKYKLVFSCNDSDKLDDEETILVLCDNEKEMLEQFCLFVERENPDIFTGYNTWGFDDKFLWLRLMRYDMDDYVNKFSRILDKTPELKEKVLNSGAYGYNEFSVIEMPGRETIDMIVAIRREFKLESFKLGEVAAHFKQGTKLSMLQKVGKKVWKDLGFTPKQIKGTSENDPENKISEYDLLFRIIKTNNPKLIKVVCDYCAHDALLPILLMEKLCIIPNFLEMAKETRVPINWLLFRGQQCKVFSLMLYNARLRNFVCPVFQKQKGPVKKFKGATVLHAMKGAYFEPVAGLDFASLYPSIMIALNMCYSTLVVDEKYMNLPGVEYETVVWDQYPKDEKGKDLTHLPMEHYEYTFVQSVPGVLPDILGKLWNGRKETKKTMKVIKDTDPFRYMVLNGKQLAQKVTMNSVYGFTGATAGMLPCKPIAASVTAKGRQMIAKTSKLAQEMYNCITTYGDSVTPETSIMIRQNGIINFRMIKNLGNQWDEYPGFKHTDNDRFCKEKNEPQDLEVWNGSQWTKIRKVIRHKVDKKIYKVLTHTGYVEVTEDHSLISSNMEYIKPKDIGVGSDLYNGYPKVDYVEKLTFDDINNYKPTTKLEKEAYILGLFYADGSCGKYNYEKTIQYSWAINNQDKNLLEKCSLYINEIFDDIGSKILETMKSSGVYKLVLVGNKKDTIIKYRNLFYEEKTKKVPNKIINDSHTHLAFISGYYTGDGSRNEINHLGKKSKVIRFCNKGQIGSSGLYYIMKCLGFDVSINTRSDKTNIFRLTSSHSMRKEKGKVKKIELMDYKPDYVYDIETECGIFQAGIGDLIVKNTDSCYVKFIVDKEKFPEDENHSFMKEHFRLAKECAAAISKTFKNPIELEFEKIMYPFMLYTKKRYAYVEWTQPDKSDKLDFKGLPIIRRDNCQYVKDSCIDMLNIIMYEQNVEKAKNMAKKTVTDLLNNKINMKKLKISKSLSNTYKIDGVDTKWDDPRIKHPHVHIARELKKIDPMNHPKPPDRVPYVFIQNKNKKALQYEKVCHPDYLGKKKIDTLYYFQHQLKNPIDVIFEILIPDTSVLYKDEERKKINKNAGLQDIRNFFKF